MVDARSPLAMKIIAANPHAYKMLVVQGGTPTLARELLHGVNAADLLNAPGKGNPQAVLAGLWLWHDGLDESHHISQSMGDATGSFWHAIMHRREGDFGNSKYWYAKAAGHPALATMAVQAADIINPLPADSNLLRIILRGFDPMAFVDLVETIHHQPDDPRHRVAVALQQLEWRMLFDYCAR